MSHIEENKALVRRIVEAGVNTGNLDVFRASLTADYARHSQATTETPEIRGIDQMLAFLRDQFGMFPDWSEEIELMIAEGPYVACVTGGTATHLGPMGDIPATGKKIAVQNFVFHRIEGGKVAETWVGWDNLAAMAQLGLVG